MFLLVFLLKFDLDRVTVGRDLAEAGRIESFSFLFLSLFLFLFKVSVYVLSLGETETGRGAMLFCLFQCLARPSFCPPCNNLRC